MTHPSDPGQPARPPAGGQPPGGPYGPPPPPHPQQQQHQQPQQHHHGTGPIPVPNPRPPAAPPGQGQPNPNQTGPGPYTTGPYPQVPPPGWTQPPRSRGLLGSLFDLDFDHMVTIKWIKAFYVLAMAFISFGCLIFAWWAAYSIQWDPTLGMLGLLATPFLWLWLMILCRMAHEFLINQFKISEYLRVIKDKS
ncbi:DUF4282 domain-containing protein [Spirillospora sp. NPDC052242]